MDAIKEYAEIEVIEALDEGEEILRDTASEVFKDIYDREIIIGTIKEYKHAIKRLLGIGDQNGHGSD